jgi:uncharacterized protein (AIM24 family)
MSALPPPVAAAGGGTTYECPYCRLASDASGTSCPHCGAPVDVRARTTSSGWQAQPPVRDLARIQFGRSTCQVSGTYVPAAEFRLAEGDRIFFSHHVLLWADPDVRLGNQPLGGAWNRTRAGLPLVMMEATGPGAVALSDDHAGETLAVPLVPGRGIDVREHRFLTATANVRYQWFRSNVWYRTRNGDETETHYPAGAYLDRFEAVDTPGLLLLHSPGNVFVRDLAAGQSICVHPGAFVWKDETVEMNLHLERPGGTFWLSSWQPASPFVRLVGPGRVAVSSVFERAEHTGRISGTSPATQVDWSRRGVSVAAVATAAARFDDGPLRAAVGGLLGPSGFAEADHRDDGPTSTTTWRHPSGMAIAVGVVSPATLVSLAQTLSGMVGSSGLSGMLANRAGSLVTAMGQTASRGGTPVEGLPVPATWRAKPGEGHLVLARDPNPLLVTVTGSMSEDDLRSWAMSVGHAAVTAG